MSQAFICDAIRTPIGRYGGALSMVRTDDLAAIPLKALMERNPKVDWSAVDDLVYGCVNQAGEDNRNVARMALLLAGLPQEVAGTTVNRLCGSSMEAIGVAARAIKSGETELMIAGGFRMGQPVHETPEDMWELMLGLNAKSVVNCARAVVPGMLAAGRGKIVNIAALAGLAGKANMGPYSASKSAVIRLTESMSAELRDKGVNVNCILPSIIDTPQNRADMPKADPRRWVAPEALADVVLFLASDAARAIHGAAIPVSGLV